MADEFQTPAPDEEPAPVEPAAEEESSDEAADFTSGEGLVALGGIVILAVWIIFEVIAKDYSVATLAIVLALLAAVLPRMKREDVEKIQRLPILMKVVGYGLAVVGIVEIIDDISYGVYDSIFGVIGALVAYAGYAMAFMGARSIKT
jgi:hypothetical protein